MHVSFVEISVTFHNSMYVIFEFEHLTDTEATE